MEHKKRKKPRFEVPKEDQERIDRAAARVTDALLENDCLLHRKDAYSSCSVYFKVDAGVACSVRISNHTGYEYLHYRFNYLAAEPGTNVWEESYYNKKLDKDLSRKYYQADALEQMIQDILELRAERMESYMDYDGLVERSLEKRHGRFWNGARLVDKHNFKKAG